MTISGLYPVGSGHNLTEATFKREQGKMSFNIYAHNFFRFYFFSIYRSCLRESHLLACYAVKTSYGCILFYWHAMPLRPVMIVYSFVGMLCR